MITKTNLSALLLGLLVSFSSIQDLTAQTNGSVAANSSGDSVPLSIDVTEAGMARLTLPDNELNWDIKASIDLTQWLSVGELSPAIAEFIDPETPAHTVRFYRIVSKASEAGPPSIVSQPQSQSVFEGDSLTFQVGAVGTEPLAYQWIFNGSAIEGETQPSLSLNAVTRDQAGSYSVTITNSQGAITSDTAILVVAPPPVAPAALAALQIEIIVLTGTGLFVSTGSARLLLANSGNDYLILPLSGNIAPDLGTYTYVTDGGPEGTLTQTSNDGFVVTFSLTMESISTGSYTAIAEGRSYSQTGTFTIEEYLVGESPPSIDGESIAVSIFSGSGSLSEAGAFRFNASADSYSIEVVGGEADLDGGTYTYLKNDATTAMIDFTDSNGLAGQLALTFFSANAGSFVMSLTGSEGDQVGTFVME